MAIRRPAGSVAAVALLIFGVFAARYGGGTSARWLDNHAQNLVGSSGPDMSASDVVIAFGSPPAVIVLATLLSGLALALRRYRLAVLAIVGPGLTGVATTALKPVIGRTFNGAFAYPSGHAGAATALGVVTALLLISVLRTTTATCATVVAAGALLSGGTMAVALIADREHYPTDTLGGFCVAVSVVLASALLIEWGVERAAARGRGGQAALG